MSTLDSPAAAIFEADGGAGLTIAKDSLAPDAESGAEDTGGPPEWLLNAASQKKWLAVAVMAPAKAIAVLHASIGWSKIRD